MILYFNSRPAILFSSSNNILAPRGLLRIVLGLTSWSNRFGKSGFRLSTAVFSAVCSTTVKFVLGLFVSSIEKSARFSLAEKSIGEFVCGSAKFRLVLVARGMAASAGEWPIDFCTWGKGVTWFLRIMVPALLKINTINKADVAESSHDVIFFFIKSVAYDCIRRFLGSM